jgi:hypothetical protein
VNFALVFFFGSFMFVLTLLLQAGLGQPPLHAGIEALPLATAFTVMSIPSPRFSARLGPRAITLGASNHYPRHDRAGGHRQQFGAASGIAVIGAIFYGVLGTAPATGTFVSGMTVAMSVNAALVAAAAAVTLLLPRRSAAGRPASGAPAREPVTAGTGRAAADIPG